MSQLLRERVKEESKGIHKHVEQSPVMVAIMKDTITAQEYAHYLADIYRIYRVLGEHYPEINQHHNKVMADINGMRDLKPKMSKTGILPSLPCQEYAEHIQSVADNKDKLMAHVYVRVLADLSGGSILKKHLSAKGFPVSMYDFEYGLKGKITTYINHEHQNAQDFATEVQQAYEFYCHILNVKPYEANGAKQAAEHYALR